MIPGISGQEGKVMDFIRDNLPSGLRPQRDAKNNIWFTAGDGRPHLLFVAHADELGFTVAEVTSQGTIKLKGRGGFLPQAELRKIFRLAEDKGIPVQARNSRGGNDGSVFVTAGAVDIPLSWPGAYAHSFIEKIERRDLDALTSLIKALAEEFR
jgi:putative aminopeptidase FrvX